MCVQVFSIPVNLLVVLVLGRPPFTPGDVFLCVLTFWDISNNVCGLLASIGFFLPPTAFDLNGLMHGCVMRDFVWGLCRIEAWLSYCAIAAWRCLSITKPLLRFLFDIRLLVIIVLLNTVLGILLVSPQFIMCEMGIEAYVVVRYSADNAEVLVIGAIIAISYWSLLRTLKAYAFHLEASTSVSYHRVNVSPSLETLLCAVAVCFLLMNVPYTMSENLRLTPCVLYPAVLLHECSFVANSLIYLLAWPAFRLRTADMFRCRIGRDRGELQSVDTAVYRIAQRLSDVHVSRSCVPIQ